MTRVSVFLTIALCVFCSAVDAQSEGRIVYEEKIDLHRRIPEERAEMKDMIPQYRTSNYELFYTESSSLYRAVPRTDEEIASQQNDRMRMRMMNAPKRQVFKNLDEDKMVDEREFMTKMFLIRGGVSPYPWKIADGQKTILGKMCLQASYQDSVNTYTVWFTPQLPIANGPAEFGGLPGMIMQVDINAGERILTASEIIETTVDATLLEEPTKGKEVTQEEFHEIVREKTREMREMHGGGSGGPMIFIHQN